VDHQHLHLIADAADIADGVDVAGRELADMHQTVAAWQNLDEGAEILDARNAAVVDLADLDGGGAGFDRSQSGVGPFAIGAGDRDRAVVLDFDDASGRFLDAADILAAGTDEHADLFRIDMRADETRSKWGDVFLGPRDGGEHLAKDLNPGLARLIKRRTNNLRADSF